MRAPWETAWTAERMGVVYGPMMIPVAIMAAGTVLSASGQMQAGAAAAAAGKAQQQASDYQAQELGQQAGQVRAQASHQAEITSRDTGIALSGGRARVAAAGTTTTSPGVVNTLGQAAGRGEYNVLAQLATGEERARGLETQSALDTFQGQQEAIGGQVKQSAGNTQALASIFTSAGSLYGKYGAGGFGATS